MLMLQLERLRLLDEQITKLNSLLAQAMTPHQDAVIRLAAVPGLGIDSATDVLSFAGSGHHVGDVAISWPATLRQAQQYGHPDQTELALLGVHGFLHLLGWDHASAAQRKEMSRLTVAALALSGLKLAPGRL